MQKWNKIFNPGLALIGLSGTGASSLSNTLATLNSKFED